MEHYTNIYSFNTANFTIDCDITDDYDVDLSFDDSGETLSNLQSGLWQSFMVRMKVTFKETGETLAEDYLGGCIYANPKDFIDHRGSRGKHGSYFRDMVSNVCSEARNHIRSIKSIYVRA